VTQAQSWTPLDLIRWTSEYFARHELATPRLDAELLLAHALGTERMQLYLRFDEPVDAERREQFRELVRLRARERVPVAYLTRVREFWSRPFEVSEATLIPRPETELLVETAVRLQPRRLADIGTGCGAVAASVALELPEVRTVAVDASPEALAVARRNLERLGVADRTRLVRGDGLEALRGGLDVIASNPPYIPSEELASLPPEVRHEPRLALDGGADGLGLLRRLIEGAPARLARPGHLVVEVGCGQAPHVAALMREAGAANVEIAKDLAGVERVVSGRFEES
jgi:release factor glutamine methyltransferase